MNSIRLVWSLISLLTLGFIFTSCFEESGDLDLEMQTQPLQIDSKSKNELFTATISTCSNGIWHPYDEVTFQSWVRYSPKDYGNYDKTGINPELPDNEYLCWFHGKTYQVEGTFSEQHTQKELVDGTLLIYHWDPNSINKPTRRDDDSTVQKDVSSYVYSVEMEAQYELGVTNMCWKATLNYTEQCNYQIGTDESGKAVYYTGPAQDVAVVCIDGKITNDDF